MREFLTLKEAGVQLIDCVHKTPNAQESGCFYIAIPQMKDGRIDTTAARLISEEDFNKWTIKANPQKWDIVLSRRCNPGVTSIVTGEFKFALGQNLVLLRSDGSKIYPPFLKWLVNSQYWWAEVSKYLNVGAVFESLRCADVPNFKFPVPAIETQKEISKTLENLDQKITLLRQQNQDLEELAQTLFKRWFVEFEFPDENGEPYKSSGGKMVESELGEIPEGWRLTPLSSIANYLNGLACQKYPIEDDKRKLPVLKIKELGNGISNNSDWVTSNVDSKYIIKNGDVIFSWSGTLMLKIWNGEDCVLNQHLFKVTSDKYPKWFIYQWTSYHLRHFIAVAQSKATTMGHIKRSHLDEAMCCVPPDDLLEKCTGSFVSLLESSINNNKEIQTLTQLRDTLLPKLMSGELRVKINA